MDKRDFRCGDCEHWTPTENKTHIAPNYDVEEIIGECYELNCTDRVDIDIRSGWDGHYIEKITTTENFFCAAFEKRKCKICKKTSEYCSCSK